jgi:hypothetical protein
MKILRGWSQEVSNNTWAKVDIQVDEEDLLRIFVNNDIDPKYVASVPTKDAFALLESEAERLLLAYQVHIGVMTVPDYKNEVAKWDNARDKALDRAKETHIAF